MAQLIQKYQNPNSTLDWWNLYKSKKIGDKTLYRFIDPQTEQIKWVDPTDSKNFQGVRGYAYYDDEGNSTGRYTKIEGDPLNAPIYQKDVLTLHLMDRYLADKITELRTGNLEDYVTPWGIVGNVFNTGMGKLMGLLPGGVQQNLAILRMGAPSYWIDRFSGLSDKQIMNGEGNLFGTNTGTALDLFTAPSILKNTGRGAKYLGNKVNTIKNNINLPYLRSFAKRADNTPKYVRNDTRIFRLGKWVSDADVSSGTEKTFTPQEIKRMYLETKRDAYKYFDSDEFKLRALNAGFTEQEYPLLLTEIKDHLNKTKLTGINRQKPGANNAGMYYASGQISPNVITKYNRFDIDLHPTHSSTQMRANIWHELMHSIGGKGTSELEYPMLTKLESFNNSVLPTEVSPAFRHQLTGPSTIEEIRKYNPTWLQDLATNVTKRKWLERNSNVANFINSEVVNKPQEFRSRLSTTLYTLRRKGYDTSELILHPEKFSEWMKELHNNSTNMPWDTNHVLVPYGAKLLGNPASKILSTTGGLYLGSQIFNNQ